MGLNFTPAEWSVQHQPTSGDRAVITQEANAGGAHVVTSLAVALNGKTSSGLVHARLWDGATIIWSAAMINIADDSKSIAIDDLSIRGTPGRSMTLEFDVAGSSDTEQTVSMTGYTENDLTPVTAVSSPIEIQKLISWFKADKGIALNGANVSQWDDPINQHNLIQATAADQPLYSSSDSDFNNKPSVTFDGGNEFLQTVAFGTALSQPITTFLVGKLNLVDGQFDFFFDGIHVDNRLSIFAGSGDIWQLSSGSSISGGATDTNGHIFAGQHNGASSNLYVDGGAANASGNSFSDTATGITMAAVYSGASLFANVTIAELIVYEALVSDANTNKIGNYLAAEYNLNWTDI